MHVLAIIPARYASSRFPGKPLVSIKGKALIEHVYDRVQEASQIQEALVATDDARIEGYLKDRGIPVLRTRADHPNGTARCAEAMHHAKKRPDYVLNIQGDEPFIHPATLNTLVAHLDGKVGLVSLMRKIHGDQALRSPHVVKVVCNVAHQALYFSRQPIPYVEQKHLPKALQAGVFHQHVGVYAYQASLLPKLSQLPVTALERHESLEQLRWLAHGHAMTMLETTHDSISIDTPEDLQRFLRIAKKA